MQPRRNYAAIDYLPSGDLLFDIRVEKQPGKGETMRLVSCGSPN